MFALALSLPLAAQAAPAARVDFATGDVAAVNKAGQSRALAKGAQVEEGETINTNAGRAQLRFTDGAYVSLQPQSEFRIDQYRYEGKQDGSERTYLSLLKGGLRTITGLVGRTNKKNYQVSTTVATIGIRGTEYTIQYGGSISGTVGEGEIEVCNGAGCINVTNGESYYVANQDVKPQLTNKGTDLPPPPPQNPPTHFEDGEIIDTGGLPVGFALIGTQLLDLLQGSAGGTPSAGSDITMEFDENGKLLAISGASLLSVDIRGNDGIMAWGTFLFDSTRLGQVALIDGPALAIAGVPLVHFVAGLPSDVSALGGTKGTYSLIGSTPLMDPFNVTVGALTSATLTVNFGAQGSNMANADMAWVINGAPFSASLNGAGSGLAGLPIRLTDGKSVNADLLFFGPDAVRAGMVYDIGSTLIGAAAFGKR
jgi:hypothetical protein